MSELGVLPVQHENMTTEDALGLTLNEARAGGIKDVVIIARGPEERLVVRSSAMTLEQGNWLLDHGKRYLIDRGYTPPE